MVLVTKDGSSSHSFAMLTGRLLYDEGTMVSKSAALRRLQRKPFVEMHADDVKALGLSDGDTAQLLEIYARHLRSYASAPVAVATA